MRRRDLPRTGVALAASPVTARAATRTLRDPLITQARERVVDDSPWVFVVHDLDPRAPSPRVPSPRVASPRVPSPRVTGFRQARSWYQDFIQVTVAD